MTIRLKVPTSFRGRLGSVVIVGSLEIGADGEPRLVPDLFDYELRVEVRGDAASFALAAIPRHRTLEAAIATLDGLGIGTAASGKLFTARRRRSPDGSELGSSTGGFVEVRSALAPLIESLLADEYLTVERRDDLP